MNAMNATNEANTMTSRDVLSRDEADEPTTVTYSTPIERLRNWRRSNDAEIQRARVRIDAEQRVIAEAAAENIGLDDAIAKLQADER